MTKLPDGYSFRPLQRDDYGNGLLDVLKDLAYVGSISKEKWNERFDQMMACSNTYYVLAIVKAGRIVGSGTLIAERKL